MAIGAAAIAWIGLAVTAAGTAISYSQQRKAQAQQERAADDQKRSNATQSALQAEQAAQEQRQQIREERIKRATILQQAENTGTSYSSGEIGATGGMATMLASNLGFNQASIGAGQRMTGFLQSAADHNQKAQTHSNRAGLYQQVSSMGSNMFSAAGGWGGIFSKTGGGSSGFGMKMLPGEQ